MSFFGGIVHVPVGFFYNKKPPAKALAGLFCSMRALLWGALCFGALRAGARSGAAALCARQGRRAPESASPPPQKAGRAERLQPPRAPGALFFKQCESHPFAKGAASVPPGTCRAFARFHPAGKLHHQLFVRFLFRKLFFIVSGTVTAQNHFASVPAL